MITDGEMRGYCDSCRHVSSPRCNWDRVLDDIEGCAVLRRIFFDDEGFEITSRELRDRMAAMVLRLLQDEPQHDRENREGLPAAHPDSQEDHHP